MMGDTKSGCVAHASSLSCAPPGLWLGHGVSGAAGVVPIPDAPQEHR